MSEESEDDFDKCMTGIEVLLIELCCSNNLAQNQLVDERSKLSADNPKNKGQRVDIEEENEQESYLRVLSEQIANAEQEEVEVLDYDSDGYPIAPKKKVLLP